MASSNTTVTKEGNVVTLSGPDMTSDFNQMKRECCGRYGNFHGKGTHTEYYDTIYCYYCVNKNNYRNYMFSPDDGENRDNHYRRLRFGVLSFYLEEGFDVYIINCA